MCAPTQTLATSLTSPARRVAVARAPGQHDDGCPAPSAQAADYLDALHVREIQVEHDQRGRVPRRRGEGVPAGGHDVGLVTVPVEVDPKSMRQPRDLAQCLVTRRPASA
jgi:hypothetical protein